MTRRFAAILLLLATTAFAQAQTAPDKVSFETVDEVELKGTFYPSDQNIKAPCALLLHNVGGSSSQAAGINGSGQVERRTVGWHTI